MLHIAWYDPKKKKTTSKSTGLEATEANWKKAENMAGKFQAELTKKSREMKKIKVKKITIKDAFDHFLRINEQKHEKTKKDYLRFYRFFTQYFNEDETCTVVSKLSVEDWLIGIKRLPLQPNSIHAIGKQCVHFLNFLFEYNYTPMFKINREVRTKPEIKEKTILSVKDTKSIFEKLEAKESGDVPEKISEKPRTKKSKEDLGKNSNFKTLVYLAYYTGLRSSDMLTITVERVNLEKGELSYYSPKRKRYREIPLHQELLPILKERIKEVKTGPILNYKSIENLGKAVVRYFKDIGLDGKGYTARTFRKTFITLARACGMDASIVRELVGHEHQSTADRYYNKIEMKVLKKELLKFKRADLISEDDDDE
jgi:integrase